ncbi:MAG: phosphoribosyltransferase family protein [Verrucomicrobiae bacterium]|nr:phosphoribosyltransferase family protein [Verrucomicrobiae bacterium]
MRFASRQEAGRLLGEYLRDEGVQADLVLGLPRGGVIVAAEVARELACPLDVLIVRKIGHPFHREFAVGALAEPDIVILDEQSIGWNPMVRMELQGILAEEKARLAEYASKFRRGFAPDLTGKAILLVDDGLATGATTAAAVAAARKRGAPRVTVAAPVASTSAVERLQAAADDVRVLWVDPYFQAVGQYYDVFDQTTDAEVLAALREAAQRTNSAG